MYTDQHDMLKFFTFELYMQIQNDKEVEANRAASLSRDITDNFMFTKEMTHLEIHQTVNQLNSLNAPGPHSIHVIFYQKILKK